MGRPDSAPPTKDQLVIFGKDIEEYRYDFERLVWILFPFGEKGHPLEHMAPYKWQVEEWRKLSAHLSNPSTRYDTYQLCISSGNGAAKTAFGCMTLLMLMYTQRLKARMLANTQPQMNTVVWPEMDLWFNHARFSEHFFEKLGTSIKSRNPKLAEIWRIDNITWNEATPAALSGLHNKGGALCYCFEEAPGIPSVIFRYAKGAFTETGTIKIFMAFGNSDDPESQFEQNMESPEWNSRRIDTRELSHIDQKQIASWLREANGNEDDDDFRVRVRGLPRKTSKDSIIRLEHVQAAIARSKDFDKETVGRLPVILSCDPAWQGGDEVTIWYRQGQYTCMLEKYVLNADNGEDHKFTYDKLCYWERVLGADQVNIDQGEGTAVWTFANQAEKHHWELIPFNGHPNDQPDHKESEYANIRAQMYYEGAQFLQKGGIIDAKKEEWLEVITRQLCWTKGGRHKINLKKLAEPKLDIKIRVGQSPDVADGYILLFARRVVERLPENELGVAGGQRLIGGDSFQMPDLPDPYDYIEAEYSVYD